MVNATQLNGQTGQEIEDCQLTEEQLAEAGDFGEASPDYFGNPRRLIVVEGFLYRLAQKR